MTNALRGFDSLRTQLPEPIALPPKPTCHQCGAVLRHGHSGTLCGPCERGKCDIPDWALTLASIADSCQIKSLANVIRGMAGLETEPLCENASNLQLLTWEQAEAIRARYAEGGITHSQLAREYGVSKPCVTSLLSGKTYKTRKEEKCVDD